MASRMTCNVKTIYNPAAEASFALRFTISPREYANLKIVVNDRARLPAIVEAIGRRFGGLYCFHVQFNWKNVPEVIVNDESFRNSITAIFQGLPTAVLPSAIPEKKSASAPAPAPMPAATPIYQPPRVDNAEDEVVLYGNSGLPHAFEGSAAPPMPTRCNFATPEKIRAAALQIRRHVAKYGSCPDFTDTVTNKNRRKILNFISSVLSAPAMSMEEALAIAAATQVI